MAALFSGAETFQVLEKLSSILRAQNLPFFVGGSVASSLRGEFRATNDIDVICFITAAILEPFIAALQSDFFSDGEYIQASVTAGRSFNIIEKQTCLKIDFFTKTGSFEQEELKRATPVVLPGMEIAIPVASAEDIILSKLVWFRKGGETSENQWKDVLGVVRIHKMLLDREYLRDWAKFLGVSDLLERIELV